MAATRFKADSPAAWYALLVLTIISLFAILDRPILILQAEIIKGALGLSDTQLGLLQGTGVALFAGVAAYPLAWLADRLDRRLVLSICLLIGALAVLGSGLSLNFLQLFLSNAFGGAGEAALVPIVLSLIPVLFSESKRQVANSIYLLASAAGGSLAMIAGGQIIGAADGVRPLLPTFMGELENWRISFVLAAIGVPAIIALLFTIRLPSREEVQAVSSAVEKKEAGGEGLFKFLGSHKVAYGSLIGGIGLSNAGFTAVSAWLVVICMRLFEQTPQQVGAAMGLASLLALPVGFGLSIGLSKAFGASRTARIPIAFMRWSWLTSAAVLIVMMFSPNALFFYFTAFIIYSVLVASGMFYPTVMQALSPLQFRARLFALQMFINAMCVAAAPVIVGLISDSLGQTARGLLVASVGIAVPILILAALSLRIAEAFVMRIEDELGTSSTPSEDDEALSALPSSPL